MAAADSACTERKNGASVVLCGRMEDGQQQLQEDNGATARLSEQTNLSFVVLEQNQQQAPTSKLKKTAFKLFGGKRSICTLPSFFGGRNKSQGKGASKKGLSKSKTHDGISDVGCEDTSAGRLQNPSDGGTDFPSPPQLPCSQSALLATDTSLRVGFAGQSGSLSGSAEGFEKKPSGDKSLFVPRPKKGLKGLFNSIRRHRKNKTTEPEKTELQEWVPVNLGAEGLTNAHKQMGAETHRASEKRSLKSTGLPQKYGENVHSDAASPGGPASLESAKEQDLLLAVKSNSEENEAPRGSSDETSRDVEPDMDAVLYADCTYRDLPDALQTEDLDSILPSVPSGDHLNLMFGDVTSLKSFDSLTGCGDIIAEPDIDNIAESSTSAEQSRDSTKRSSCLVTYQGGGEEMALPDELEEYLQQVWESAVKADLSELVSNRELLGVNSSKHDDRLYARGTRSNVDLLTPHSDHQESAPNSDEGYYDSTTPGPDDEAGDGLEEIKKDRLPRDSYSGDALYEFYEPDDTLMSPPHGDEAWFDRKTAPLDIFGRFLDFAVPVEEDSAQMMRPKRAAMETEEERLAAIQKQLLYWELQAEPVLKQLDMLSKEQHPRDKLCSKYKQRTANLIGKSPNCLDREQAAFCALSRNQNDETRDWKEFQELLCQEKSSNGCRDPKAHSSCLNQLMGNGLPLDSDVEQTALDSCALSHLALEKSSTYPFYTMHSCLDCLPSEQHGQTELSFQEAHPESNGEPEQVVNFSQALVEFTSSGSLFSSLSERLSNSDSGSAFTQNLPALPAMVTFDIVDVDQEGEGECEQHLEINADEDIGASFEAFDRGYNLKESFSECDERVFPGYPQSSFQSGNWGVGSLPRHLRLQELSPSVPEPLSNCRRSRSLDTEVLEFELANLQLTKNDLKPSELWAPWSGPRKGSVICPRRVGQENAASSPEEREDASIPPPWSDLQNVSYGDDFSSRDGKPWDCNQNAPAFQSTWDALEPPGTQFLSLAQNSATETGRPPPDEGTSDLIIPAPRSTARPSDLPLLTPLTSQEVSAGHKHGGDNLVKKLAWVLPLGERHADLPQSFSRSPDKPATYKPVGMMQGMPPFHSNDAECGAEYCEKSDAYLLKARPIHWNVPSASCRNASMNITIAK